MFTDSELITVEYALQYVIQDIERVIKTKEDTDWLMQLQSILYKIKELHEKS